MNRVIVTQSMLHPSKAGLYALAFMQVCAAKDATDEEILAVCNSENPAGTSAGWTTVLRTPEGNFVGLAPVTCEDNPDRLHFIVGC